MGPPTGWSSVCVKNQLTIHADRGSSMRSKPVACLLADLSVTKTHSRPYTSNDNPYSEKLYHPVHARGWPDFPYHPVHARGWPDFPWMARFPPM